jgi:hypothetical protein
MSKKKRHYSERLGRAFRDGDELTREEAAQVLAENSGRPVEPKYVFDLVRLGIVQPRYLSPRKLLYQYSEIKQYVVASHVGKKPHEKPTDNALRQRRFRDRRRGASDDAQKKMEASLAC